MAAPILAQERADGAPPAADPATDSAFQQGVERYRAKRYLDALESFRSAYRQHPTPNVQLAIARTLRELARYAEAAETYEQLVEDARSRAANEPQYERARDTALLELEPVYKKIGRLTLELATSASDYALTVNGESVPVSRTVRPIPVPAGHLRIQATAPGHLPYELSRDVVPGTLLHVRVELEAALPPEDTGSATERVDASPVVIDDDPTWKILGWTGVGLGVAAIGAAVAFHALADDQFDTLVARCVEQPCSSKTRDDLESTGRTYDLLMSLGYGVGAVAAVAGVTLLIGDVTFLRNVDVSVSRSSLIVGARGTF